MKTRGCFWLAMMLAAVGCGSSEGSDVDGGVVDPADGGFAVVDGEAADASPQTPPSCGGGAMFIADHLIIPAGPEAQALGVARWRLVRASWDESEALRAAGFDDAGRLVLEGQWVFDGPSLSEDSVEPSVLAEAITHVIEELDGAPLALGAEQTLWEEIGAYLASTPCVLELEPWVPAGRASAALSTERGASARCSSESVDSFRAWIRALPRIIGRLFSGDGPRVPLDLREPFQRAAEHNCCMGANTPWLGFEGCTCVERFGAAFPVRREYPDPSGGFDAEHVCEACPSGLEWRDDLRRCGAPLDGPAAPEVGACPSAGGGVIDYETLRARLADIGASSPQIQVVEVVGGRGGSCAPLESAPLYVPCSARDGVPYLARPAGGAIDTNVTAGLLGSDQWLWHMSYAVEGMLDRGLLDSGDIDGTGSIYSTGFAPGTPEVTVCDDAMAAGPFGGRAVATPILAFPDRVVGPEERAAAGLDPAVAWCADRFIAKFSTSMLRCNASRIRGSNFLVLFPESESCGGTRPPEGVAIDASAALCVCPLDAPRWDPEARRCECTEEGHLYDPVEGRCRPEEYCFGALGSQCTPLQRDPAFAGIFPVSCGVDHVGPPTGVTPCTADPWFREVVDADGRALQWQSVGVGSLRHDQCCRQHPEGFLCGKHGSLFGACRQEFNLAVADFLSPGATWGRLFDPEAASSSDIFVDGDWRRDELTEYGRGLRAGAGADVRDGDDWACASGETWDRPRCQRVCAPDATGRGRWLDGTEWPLDDKNDYDNPRPVYRQPTASSCGAAAVAMVLEDESAMAEMIDRCGLDDASGGTNARELAATLRRRDQLYTPVQLHDIEGLAEVVDVSGSPAIALIEVLPGDRSTRHWIVLDEVVDVDFAVVGECETRSFIVRDSQALGSSYVWSIDDLAGYYVGVAVIPGSAFDGDGLNLPIDAPAVGPFDTSYGVPVDAIAGTSRGALGSAPLVPPAIRNPWPMLVRGWGPQGFVTWDDVQAIVPPGTPNSFTPDPNHRRGFKYQWQDSDGRRLTVWGHGPTASPNAGANATSGPTVRVRVGNRMLSQQLRDITVPNNATRANETHIPLVDCPVEYCLPVP